MSHHTVITKQKKQKQKTHTHFGRDVQQHPSLAEYPESYLPEQSRNKKKTTSARKHSGKSWHGKQTYLVLPKLLFICGDSLQSKISRVTTSASLARVSTEEAN
jgi:hypothetical protein